MRGIIEYDVIHPDECSRLKTPNKRFFLPVNLVASPMPFLCPVFTSAVNVRVAMEKMQHVALY